MEQVLEGSGNGYSDEAISRFTFCIPEDGEWLALQVDYEQNGLWVQYYLWDPQGRLRYQHLDWLNPRKGVIHRDPALTSYLGVPGSIGSGEWTIEFYNPTKAYTVQWQSGKGALPEQHAAVIPTEQRTYWVSAHDETGAPLMNLYDWQASEEAEERWYKGDLHAHCSLSDGRKTPEQMMRRAEENGLDYFAITDHNVLSTSWPVGSPLVIPGIEVTSVLGHCNLIGLRQWVDWRVGAPDAGMNSEDGMRRIFADARRAGAICSINHSLVDKWQWKCRDTRLADVDTVEVINYPSLEPNRAGSEQCLRLWNVLWQQGYRIYGIGGSDTHFIPGESDIGEPSTYVWAKEKSAEAILDGIRAGRVYVSTGPQLACTITVDGIEYPLGSDLTEAVRASSTGAVHVRVDIEGLAKGQLVWIENGHPVASESVSDDEVDRISDRKRQNFERVFNWKDNAYCWLRVEVRDEHDDLAAFTNPVFTGSRSPEIETWEELLTAAGVERNFA